MTINRKIYLAAAVSVVLPMLIVVFAVYPFFSAIQESAQEFVAQKEQLATLEAESANLRVLKADYNEFQPNLQKINNLFINPSVPVDFISFLEEAAKSSNVNVKISSVSSQGQEDIWPFLIFQVETSSSFPNFLKFLEKLESSPYLVSVQDLNAIRSSQAKQGSPNDIKTIFSIKVYTTSRQ